MNSFCCSFLWIRHPVVEENDSLDFTDGSQKVILSPQKIGTIRFQVSFYWSFTFGLMVSKDNYCLLAEGKDMIARLFLKDISNKIRENPKLVENLSEVSFLRLE